MATKLGELVWLLAPIAFLGAACAETPNDELTSQDDAAQARWGVFPRRVIRVPRSPTPATPASDAGSSGGSGPSTGAPSATDDDAAEIINAARTPDGRAIPQPAGPGGVCPPVVALLGFWACPTLDETCTYTAEGMTHDCLCNRVDGEGQASSWVCD
jgi:hypothetical protein